MEKTADASFSRRVVGEGSSSVQFEGGRGCRFFNPRGLGGGGIIFDSHLKSKECNEM